MNRPRLIWLSLPALVFVAIMILFVSKLPRPAGTSTIAKPNPTPYIYVPKQKSAPTDLQNLNQQLKNFNLNDPNLTPPAFDRRLDIPSD